MFVFLFLLKSTLILPPQEYSRPTNSFADMGVGVGKGGGGGARPAQDTEIATKSL